MIADQVAAPSSVLIDSHAHVNTTDVGRYPLDPVDGKLAPTVLSDALPADALVAAMDANGVARAVIVQRCHVYGFDNSYILDMAAAFPERLQPLCVIDGRVDDAPAAAIACLDRGAVGIRYMEPERDRGIGWLASDGARAAWRATVERGGSMRVHLFRWNRADGLAAISRMMAELPETRLVVDHLTNLDPAQDVDAALTSLADCENANLLFSTVNLKRWAADGIDPAPVVARAVALFGADRVTWGSDVGNTLGDYGEMIARAQAAAGGLDAAARSALFGGTAARLYPAGTACPAGAPYPAGAPA